MEEFKHDCIYKIKDGIGFNSDYCLDGIKKLQYYRGYDDNHAEFILIDGYVRPIRRINSVCMPTNLILNKQIIEPYVKEEQTYSIF